MATSGTTFLLSDLIRQGIEHRHSSADRADSLPTNHIESKQPIATARFEWDAARSLRMAALGCCLHAPFIHLWLQTADRVFGAGFSWAKLAADQALAFPLFLAAFLSANEVAKRAHAGAYTNESLALNNTSADSSGHAGAVRWAAAAAADARRKLEADFVATYQTGFCVMSQHCIPPRRCIFYDYF